MNKKQVLEKLAGYPCNLPEEEKIDLVINRKYLHELKNDKSCRVRMAVRAQFRRMEESQEYSNYIPF